MRRSRQGFWKAAEGPFLKFLSKRYCEFLRIGYFVSPVTERVVPLTEVSRSETHWSKSLR